MLEAGQNLILVTSKIYMKRFRFYSRYLVLRLILSVSTRFMFEPSDSEVKPIFRLPLEVRVTIRAGNTGIRNYEDLSFNYNEKHDKHSTDIGVAFIYPIIYPIIMNIIMNIICR